MKPIKECILITDHRIASLFSGSDVWLIPVEESFDFSESGDSICSIKIDWNRAYVGDDWYIQNEAIWGYREEALIIAVEPEQMMWKTAPEYMAMKEEENYDT